MALLGTLPSSLASTVDSVESETGFPESAPYKAIIFLAPEFLD